MGAGLCCIGTGHGGTCDMKSGAGNGAGLGCMGAEHEDRVGMESGDGGGDRTEEEDEKWWLVNRVSIFR